MGAGDGEGDGSGVWEGVGCIKGVRVEVARAAVRFGGVALTFEELTCAAPDAVQALQARTARSMMNNIEPGLKISPCKDCAPV